MRVSKAYRSNRISFRSSTRLIHGRQRCICFRCSLLGVIRQRFEAFRQKFGRPPGPQDPLFFDPRADLPVLADREVIREQLLAAASAIGLDGNRVLERLGMS
jgi:hypothetical protein